jgi:hypothetical protein
MDIINVLGVRYKIDAIDCIYAMLDRQPAKNLSEKNRDILNKKGVYLFFNWDDVVIRVGKAKLLRNRILQYERMEIGQKLFQETQYVGVIYEKLNEILEVVLIEKFRPKFNIHWNYTQKKSITKNPGLTGNVIDSVANYAHKKIKPLQNRCTQLELF